MLLCRMQQLVNILIVHSFTLRMEIKPVVLKHILQGITTPSADPPSLTTANNPARTPHRSATDPFSCQSDSPRLSDRIYAPTDQNEQINNRGSESLTDTNHTLVTWILGVYFIYGICDHSSGMLPRIYSDRETQQRTWTWENTRPSLHFTICSVSTKLAT